MLCASFHFCVLRDPVQYDYLIRGSKKLGVDKHSQLDWLPLQAWYAIQKLIELSGFEKLAADMLASPNRFKEWSVAAHASQHTAL